MYDVVIGIDPGYKGALAIYDLHTDSLVDLQDCPVFVVEEVKANKKKKKVTKYKKFQMYQQLLPALHFTRPAGTPHRVLVVLERVHAMPKQGTCSMFTFGYGYGLWEMAVAVSGMSLHTVPAATWAADLFKGLPRFEDTKSRNIAYVKSLFPGVRLVGESSRCRADKDGRADAICLAVYGAKHWREINADSE